MFFFFYSKWSVQQCRAASTENMQILLGNHFITLARARSRRKWNTRGGTRTFMTLSRWEPTSIEGGFLALP